MVNREQRKALGRKIRKSAFQHGIEGAHSLEVQKNGNVAAKEGDNSLSFSDANVLISKWPEINSGLKKTYQACGFGGKLTLNV